MALMLGHKTGTNYRVVRGECQDSKIGTEPVFLGIKYGLRDKDYGIRGLLLLPLTPLTLNPVF